MSAWASHLVIVPIVLPLAVGALLLLVDERHPRIKGIANLVSIALIVLAATTLLADASAT